MSKTDKGPDYVMAVEDGLTWPGAGVLRRGDVVTVPECGTDAYAATVDRHGVSWLDDLSADAQMRRWGVVFLARLDKGAAEQDAAARVANELAADPGPQRPAPIRPDPIISSVMFPSGLAARPEGSTPIVTSDGRIVSDRR